MDGLIEESQEIVKEDVVRDVALISPAQRVEHYEIAGYGCAPGLMQGWWRDNRAEDLVGATLDEESATDKKLTGVTTSVVNIKTAS